MKRTLRIVSALGLFTTVTWCQDSTNLVTEPRETLRGLLGVTVEADHNGCGGIVDKELAKQDIEVKLRIAGIRITQLPVAVLGMMADCLPVENSGRRISTIIDFSLFVRQIVWLPPPPQPVRVWFAKTWENGHLLVCGAATKCDDYFRSELRNYVDKFIIDFLTVNPKQ